MILTLKDQNSVWVAVDAGALLLDAHGEDNLQEDNLNLWRVPHVKNCIMSSLRCGGMDLDRIRYQKHLGLSAPLTQTNLILKTIPKLKDVFEECDMMDGNESWQTFVIAKKDRAFVILPNFTCCEIEDFEIFGRGEDVLHGTMCYYKDLPPVERITKAFHAMEEMRSVKRFPIVIMNTMRNDRIVIYE